MFIKSEKSDQKRREITTIALDLFFSKGFEGTSIREIQRRYGKKAGLFYYYFKDKDEVFDASIDLFFERYLEDMDRIAYDEMYTPLKRLLNFIDYLDKATQKFREDFLKALHWSVVGAIRERTLRIANYYFRIILEKCADVGDIIEHESLDVVSTCSSMGISGSILYQSNEDYERQKDIILKSLFRFIGATKTYEELNYHG